MVTLQLRRDGSSPPARGCSRARGGHRRDDRVVPARAGVFPAPDGHRGPGEGRPRPRGGVPTPIIAGELITSVVPARAGVFRESPAALLTVGGRPRPRGGVPTASAAGAVMGVSSPPARGCSVPLAPSVDRPRVVPARAGVFPTERGPGSEGARRPRPRGGVPLYSATAVFTRSSSPPARGCSQAHRPGDRLRGVVPARAGVFPHERVVGEHGRVVPARAGVFLRTRRCCVAVGCRPRPRGGVPGSSSRTRRPPPSSPPARGCSGALDHHAVVVIVVPARAGVFRLVGAPRRPG